jgi:hypothetical protein
MFLSSFRRRAMTVAPTFVTSRDGRAAPAVPGGGTLIPAPAVTGRWMVAHRTPSFGLLLPRARSLRLPGRGSVVAHPPVCPVTLCAVPGFLPDRCAG